MPEENHKRQLRLVHFSQGYILHIDVCYVKVWTSIILFCALKRTETMYFWEDFVVLSFMHLD